MALHHETGGSVDGLALADYWSSKRDKYPGFGEIANKWKTFENYAGDPVTIGTLFNMVEDNGFDWISVCEAIEPQFIRCEYTVIHQPDFKSAAIDPKRIKIVTSGNRTSENTSSCDSPESNTHGKSIDPGQRNPAAAFFIDDAKPLDPEKFPDQRTGGNDNSRWWTIPVVSINYEHGIDMQQVFAQPTFGNSGRSLLEIQTLLGHASPKVSMRYSHLSQQTLMDTSNTASDRITSAMKKSA